MSLDYRPLPSQDRLLELLDYDPATGSLFRKDLNKPAFTAQDVKGYRVGSIDNILYRANRIIWKLMTGNDPEQVDHENGVTSDDRWGNLKNVTHTNNQRNMKKPKTNKSGVTGVCFNTGKNKWQATIGVNGKAKVLGRFDTIEEAIACRKQGEEFYGYHPNHGR